MNRDNGRCCPKCNRPGEWRIGLYYEHEMICWCGGERCITWNPVFDEIELLKKRNNADKENIDNGCCN
jgi:hypothetical protein